MEPISSHWISAFLYEKAAFCTETSTCQVSVTWNYRDHEMTRSFPLPLEAVGAHTLHCHSISVRKFVAQTSTICQPQPPLRAAKQPSWCFLHGSPGPPGHGHTCCKSQKHPLAFHRLSHLPRSSSSHTSAYHPSLQSRILESTDQRQKVQEPREVITKFGKALSF